MKKKKQSESSANEISFYNIAQVSVSLDFWIAYRRRGAIPY